MTIFEYYKQNNNKEIYNKKIAYNILLSINDLHFNNENDFNNLINTKLNDLKNLHRFCNKEKIKSYIINNYKNFNGQILTSFKELDQVII